MDNSTSAPPSLKQIGQYISAITNSFRNTGLRYANGMHADAPQVLRDHLGPPMDVLPSFSHEEQRTEKPYGMGVFFDRSHAATRLMGKNIGLFLSGKSSTTGTLGTFLETRDAVTEGAQETLGDTSMPVEVGERKKGVELIAISQRFAGRPDRERELLDRSIGNADKLYANMLGMVEKIEGRLSHLEPDQREEVLKDKGIILDRQRVGEWLHEAQPHIAKLANFFILTHDIQPNHVLDCGESLDALLEAAGKEDRAIVVRSRDDAAIATYSLFLRLIGQDVENQSNAKNIGTLCDRIARTPSFAERKGGSHIKDPVQELSLLLKRWQRSDDAMDTVSREACEALSRWISLNTGTGLPQKQG